MYILLYTVHVLFSFFNFSVMFHVAVQVVEVEPHLWGLDYIRE